MGRKALSPEQKAQNDAYRSSPVGMQERVLKSKIKTVVNSADALKASQPDLSGKISDVVTTYRNYKMLNFQLEHRPDSYVGNVKANLERRVQSLRNELAETEARLNTVDVNASREALTSKVNSLRNKLNQSITDAGSVHGRPLNEVLELEV